MQLKLTNSHVLSTPFDNSARRCTVKHTHCSAEDRSDELAMDLQRCAEDPEDVEHDSSVEYNAKGECERREDAQVPTIMSKCQPGELIMKVRRKPHQAMLTSAASCFSYACAQRPSQ